MYEHILQVKNGSFCKKLAEKRQLVVNNIECCALFINWLFHIRQILMKAQWFSGQPNTNGRQANRFLTLR